MMRVQLRACFATEEGFHGCGLCVCACVCVFVCVFEGVPQVFLPRVRDLLGEASIG